MKKLLLTLGVLGTAALTVTAQEAPQGGAEGRGGPRGPEARPMNPFVAALDTNKDGEIDATELANASASLKTLDKNQDGKLSGDEIRPARGDRGPGGPEGQGDRRGRGPGGGQGRGPGGPEGERK